MALTIGTQLGSHEITALLGKGGMGEVYRARDLKLKREVAIKILPEEFGGDADRLIRFQREAEVLASLNHPNIAGIYDLQEANGFRYLVLELVEGETLADRITRGPVPLDEALKIATDICEALETAHERGIIHRDLKPANIKVTGDGKVKVLDFGLAKAFDQHGVSPLSQSPTVISQRSTMGGVILGTAAYMSPEQARGKEVDRRTDIWAFGCVMCELLSGKQAFAGETVTDLFANIIKSEPEWNTVPLSIRSVLRRCLQKDPRKRWQSIGDVRIALEEALESPAGASGAVPALRRRLSLATALAIVVLTGALATVSFVHFRETVPEERVLRTSILLPEIGASQSFQISPDGRRIVLSTRSTDGKVQLWVRSLDTLTAEPLAGSEGARFPFWSPDGQWLGFFADRKLKKIDPAGGPALTLCDVPGQTGQDSGATWGADGVVIFATGSGALRRVSASGGMSSPATTLDQERAETAHVSPSFLPDGRHFIYWAFGGKTPAIRVASIQSGGKDSRIVMQPETGLLPSLSYGNGYLLFLKDATLMAQPFDLKRLTATGEPVLVVEQAGSFSLSQNESLIYQKGVGNEERQLAWFDRSGTQSARVGEPGQLRSFDLSPDEKSVALTIDDPTSLNPDIWILEVMRGLRTRFTFDPAADEFPSWSPDGRSLVFASTRKGHRDLYRKAVDGAPGSEELLYADNMQKVPTSWSRDGKYLLYYSSSDAKRKGDLWILPMTGERKPFPFAQTEFTEAQGAFSPDGRWIAYVSDESGVAEIYAAPFPGPGAKVQISTKQKKTGQGGVPSWSPDGKEIFYIAPDRSLMAVDVKTNGTTLEAGTARKLFGPIPGVGGQNYEVSLDGQHFLTYSISQTGNEPLTLVQNWAAALKKAH